MLMPRVHPEVVEPEVFPIQEISYLCFSCFLISPDRTVQYRNIVITNENKMRLFFPASR